MLMATTLEKVLSIPCWILGFPKGKDIIDEIELSIPCWILAKQWSPWQCSTPGDPLNSLLDTCHLEANVVHLDEPALNSLLDTWSPGPLARSLGLLSIPCWILVDL